MSIHVLGADIGCIPRHAFDADADFVKLFQSGYTNVDCADALDDDHSHGHGHDHVHTHDELP